MCSREKEEGRHGKLGWEAGRWAPNWAEPSCGKAAARELGRAERSARGEERHGSRRAMGSSSCASAARAPRHGRWPELELELGHGKGASTRARAGGRSGHGQRPREQREEIKWGSGLEGAERRGGWREGKEGCAPRELGARRLAGSSPWTAEGGRSGAMGEEPGSLRAAVGKRRKKTRWLKEEKRGAARGGRCKFSNLQGEALLFIDM
jgi:hypothetical protein